jgi:dipeptidyl aminopeptidase/acylaminoacyl peptidase
MLLQAAAGRIPFKAIATAGAISDLELMAGEVPDLDREFQKMMPDYAADKAQHFCRRSAICWADKITAPVLLAHGGADGVVSAAHDQRLSAKLELLHKPYRALVLGGADHGLSGARQVFFDAAQQFFEHPPAKP